MSYIIKGHLGSLATEYGIEDLDQPKKLAWYEKLENVGTETTSPSAPMAVPQVEKKEEKYEEIKSRCARHWCWTIHLNCKGHEETNHTQERVDQLLKELKEDERHVYSIFSLEKTQTDGLHYQGWSGFTMPLSLGPVKKIFGQYTWIHLEKMRYSSDVNTKYVTKKESHVAGPWCVGDPTACGQGNRSIWACVELIKKGATEEKLWLEG